MLEHAQALRCAIVQWHRIRTKNRVLISQEHSVVKAAQALNLPRSDSQLMHDHCSTEQMLHICLWIWLGRGYITIIDNHNCDTVMNYYFSLSTHNGCRLSEYKVLKPILLPSHHSIVYMVALTEFWLNSSQGKIRDQHMHELLSYIYKKRICISSSLC